MNPLLSYEFEETPVRVVMVGDEPWFVATDLAKVMEYSHTPHMMRVLDDDEKGVHIVDTLGGTQELSIISESGMYAVILKSRRAEARRFRKWVTAEVLPTLRKTGRFVLHDHDPVPPVAGDYDPPRLMASVAVVREARRLFGPQSARSVWEQLGLPTCIVDAEVNDNGDPMAGPIREWLDSKVEVTATEVAEGIGLRAPLEFGTVQRIGRILHLVGWKRHKVRRGDKTYNAWVRRAAMEG